MNLSFFFNGLKTFHEHPLKTELDQDSKKFKDGIQDAESAEIKSFLRQIQNVLVAESG